MVMRAPSKPRSTTRSKASRLMRRPSAARILTDFSEPVYKAGARLYVTDTEARTTTRVFVPLELRLEKLPSDESFPLDGQIAKGTPKNLTRSLCVIAQEPKSRAKSRLVLHVADIDAFRSFLQDTSDEENAMSSDIEAVRDWLQGVPGASIPSNHVISSVLACILHCTKTEHRFELVCDPGRMAKLERVLSARRPSSAHIPRSAGGSASHAREIKLVSGARPPRTDLSLDEESDEATEAATRAFQAKQNMKEQNQRMRAGSASNSDHHLTQASITVKSIASELQRQQDGIVAQNIAATAFQADEVKKLDELRSGHSKRREENRAYRQKMQEAVAANELAMRLEAKARREKVRHTREMARMKWSCFPFANGGRWQKGTVIGPGPLPIRKLALLKRPSLCDEEQDKEEIHLSSHHRHRHQSGPSPSQRDRVAAAFELLRRLAKTYDPHYLDFDRAFLRLDRASRGFLRPADFRVMMRPLSLSDDDHMLLWSHFDRNQSGFVAKDDLVWGFYNKRQVLQEAQRVDDSTLFRAEVLDHIIHEQKINGGASVEGDRATEGSKKKDSSENNKTTVMVRLGGVRELHDLPGGYKVFCIASCCQICKDDNEDTLIISSEARSEVAVAKSMGNNLHSMQVNWDDDSASIELPGVSTKHIEMEHLLLEFRATAPGATSDVNSLFLGEIFFPLTQLDLRTASDLTWLSLRHGAHRGQAQVQVRVAGLVSATRRSRPGPRQVNVRTERATPNFQPAREIHQVSPKEQYPDHVDEFPRERAAAKSVLLSLLQDTSRSPLSSKTRGHTGDTEDAYLDRRYEQERREAKSQLDALLRL